MSKEELNKAMEDAKIYGFGCYDTESGLRIQPDKLTFVWNDKKKRKLVEEVKLHSNLLQLEKIYKEKYGILDIGGSMELGLFNADPEAFVERLIRAVEICTLRYVLGVGGGLNLSKRQEIVKGHRKFIWEF